LNIMTEPTVEQALNKAAACEQRARSSKNPDLKDFYLRWRDSWIAAAVLAPEPSAGTTGAGSEVQ